MRELNKLSRECIGCKEHCCGKRSPSFFNEKEVKKLIGKNKNNFSFYKKCARSKGICCFYKTPYCTIYKKRPIDCRTYPTVIDLENGKEVVFIDMKCPAVRKRIIGKRFINYAMKLWKDNWPSKNYFTVNSKDNKAGRYELVTLSKYIKHIENKD